MEELECAARRAGVTLYMLLLTGLHLALRVMSGQDDFVVRAPGPSLLQAPCVMWSSLGARRQQDLCNAAI